MLNPITYTERVVQDFLRYQLTAYPLADERLQSQMRALLSLESTRDTPLWRGPYIGLSRPFRMGAALADLAADGVLHPHVTRLADHPTTYGHQEEAIRAIHGRRHTLVATGTGSGKTEAFLYPIVSRCLQLRDEGAPAGISAVIVYPMNALAEDQLGRLRDLLAGTGIPFGMYVGKTPSAEKDVIGIRLPHGSSRADYRAALRREQAEGQGTAVLPFEERASRDAMCAPGGQPRILLTNVKQLELLLTRHRDIGLFQGARLDHLVFDEAHTFTGAMGGETACLIRRLRAHCGKGPGDTVCIATSATIADPAGDPDAGRRFASRFFGVPAGDVALVGERYAEETWAVERAPTAPLAGDPAVQLVNVLDAVGGVEGDEPGPADVQRLCGVYAAMTGSALDARRWSASLHERLAANEVVYQIAQALERPRPLAELVAELDDRLGRPVTEEEILVWLAFGAVARREESPLLRPVAHGFVRGVGGAVVAFPAEHDGPRLWLDAADAQAGHDASAPGVGPATLPVLTCTTCGQHYFEHHAADLDMTAAGGPGGGQQSGDRTVWEAQAAAQGGRRVLLLDRTLGAGAGDDEGGDEGDAAGTPRNTVAVWFCAACGTLHDAAVEVCLGSCGVRGRVLRLWAVRQSADDPGQLTRCVTCQAHGGRWAGRYREPARPVRAVTAADVHVLAQSLLQHARRKRLLVFSDNRQDAAFQAGWMRDRARRFRLRALMFRHIDDAGARGISVGDLTARLDEQLEADDDLSRDLLPEVWAQQRKEAAGLEHARDRRFVLRVQVLRELTASQRQRLGLEPWGRIRVDYLGLDASLPWVERWSERLSCPPEALLGGVRAMVDHARRKGALLDREREIFGRRWREGDREVGMGYLPLMEGIPVGYKLRRGAKDDPSRVAQWQSAKGQTLARFLCQRWGVPEADREAFLEELWGLLTDDLRLLVQVVLRGFRGTAMPGTQGAHQVDADRLLVVAHRGRYRCTTCRMVTLHPTPNDACVAYRCTGTTAWQPESDDDYDLALLDHPGEMVRPREHSAQIPDTEREVIENLFKGTSDHVNTLVCTPTLELGVDIGALDAVLMRNVPPRPANYRQRAGRAGRRHRMAVNVTYARPASHDRAYFDEPLKMLDGPIDPPAFNLRNPHMVARHVHSTVIGRLHHLASDDALLAADRSGIADALAHGFPNQVRDYLWSEDGTVRAAPRDVQPLRDVLARHAAPVLEHVRATFGQEWPAEDAEVVAPEVLRQVVEAMPDRLEEIVARLHRRLRWALDQLALLAEQTQRLGTLGPEGEVQQRRCKRLIARLKGEGRSKADAEGFDDSWTFGVLAAEGFLPGYGLDTGSIVAYHQRTGSGSGLPDWELRRSPAMALREYVPGNLIYAAGQRYLARGFHLEPEDAGGGAVRYHVDVAHEAVVEEGAPGASSGVGLGARAITAIPMCDVDVPHQSAISDQEDYRFQMPVAVYGARRDRHEGGRAYAWSGAALHHLRAEHLRLVNVGAGTLVRAGGQLGYPVCRVCGQSRSPLAGQADRDRFAADHLRRCGQRVEPTGFFADIVADSLALVDCPDRALAYSVLETLRQGTAAVLDMAPEDLQILVVGQPGEDTVRAVLYDPMPGGSGLLDQMLARWSAIVAQARRIATCPSACERACIDCLQTFRNAHYHAHLDRHAALEALAAWGDAIERGHAIPSSLPAAPPEGKPVNKPEERLLDMLARAGFTGAEPQRPVDLAILGFQTIPDVFYRDPYGRTEGVCLYLDGMSDRLHGNPRTAQRDRAITEELCNTGYEVRRIPVGDLDDRQAMAEHFHWLGQQLVGTTRAREIRDRAADWHASPDDASNGDPPGAGPEDALAGWDAIDDLLEPAWHPLARALQAAGLPGPSEFLEDVMRDGRATGHTLVMVWETGRGRVAVVDREVDLPETRLVVASSDGPFPPVVEALRTHLEG